MGRKLAPTVALVALLAVGCGSAASTQSTSSSSSSVAAQQAPTLHAHPQAVEPVAGAVAGASQASTPPSSFSVGSSTGAAAQPVSDAQVRQELAASGLSAQTRKAQE